ncbi:MAG: protein translocase subunit SecF, partial [Firmicutes bacterium]|nr:protein translocase subunit SecF [Bacillota bacterium]
MRYHVNFLKHWRVWLLASGLLMVLALGAFFIRGLNYGIDFTGGTEMNLQYVHTVSDKQINKVLAEQHIAGSRVVFAGAKHRDVLITTPPISEHQRDMLLNRLNTLGKYKEISTSRVSSTIGQQTERHALLAVVLAVIAIILYIAVRFEWRFAFSGILAMVHDVVISVGLIALIHIQVNETF